MHRFLLCMLLLSLIAAAQPGDRASANTEAEETWSVSSDDGGTGSSYLGVDIADVTPERLSDLKLKEEHGAEVTMVDEDAPAGKAGLREHDVILSLNGTLVESAAQLRRMIRETPPGRVVTLGISRDGQPISIKLQLADRKTSMSWHDGQGINVKIPPISIPPIPEINVPVSVVIAYSSMRSGLMVENITPQLGEFFGVKSGRGVLIRSVEKGSRGEKAGFRAGDVIVKVNDQPVHDTSDFNHALRGSGNTVAITVVRDKREQNLTLPLPDRKDSGELLEDSFAIPEISAETQFAIDKAQGELAGLGSGLDMEKLQREMEQTAEAQIHSQKCLQRQQEQLKKQAEGQQKKMLEFQQKMLQQQEKLRHEMDGSWSEI
jgi:serine protease Do